jgi:hypothetical protein
VYQAFSEQLFNKRLVEARNNKSVNLKDLPLDLKGEYLKFTNNLAVQMFYNNLTEVKYNSEDE